jgi:4-amino-4-deoxy-L-arabinose transferase-like glycosyltransferase
MTQRAIPTREAATWAAGFLLVATLIIGTGFTSQDPDSALYAGISGRLTDEPISRWVAPEWWDFWPDANLTGLFQEHPAGVFLLPAALGRLGMPPEQAAYVVGVAAGLLSLLLLATIISELTSARDARAALILLQFMPLAFLFRIRANHEYPMLACLLLTILGLQRVRRSRWWMSAVALGLVGGLLIKGVFVSLIVLAAGLWVVVGLAGDGRERRRAWIAMAAGVTAMAATAVIWDAAYVTATGQTFWTAYWTRQLGSVIVASHPGDLLGFAARGGFYVVRLLWHPAPWSLALIWIAWRHPAAVRGLSPTARRALLFTVLFAGVALILLSVPSRFAERYAFSPAFVLGALGAVVASRHWSRLGAALARADARVPMLPAILWTLLAVSRLVLGPVLPRI